MNLAKLELRTKYVLVLAPLLIISVILAMVVYPLYYDRIYDGVMLEEFDVQAKSREELVELLRQWNERCRGKTVRIQYDNTEFLLRASDAGFAVNVEKTAETVWNYGRTGAWWERIRSIRAAQQAPIRLPLITVYDTTKLNQIIEEWQHQIDRAPRNASVSIVTGGIIPESAGRKLLADELKTELLRAFYRTETRPVTLPVIAVQPAVTAESLRNAGIAVMQTFFSTRFNPNDVSRTTNVRLAAERINGKIVQPGQTFSFNEIVGPRDKASGFQEALEFFDGELVPGIGGGVCQVSSTLYNAVLLANLDVKERLNHAKPLSYVELGRDATVVYGVLDFKFINSSGSPVMILSEVKDDTLFVAVFGREKLKEDVAIIVTEKKEIPPVTVKKPDPELFVGETKLDKQGVPGYDVKVYRVVALDGKVVKREFLGKDQYLPDNTIIKTGAKERPKDGGKAKSGANKALTREN